MPAWPAVPDQRADTGFHRRRTRSLAVLVCFAVWRNRPARPRRRNHRHPVEHYFLSSQRLHDSYVHRVIPA